MNCLNILRRVTRLGLISARQIGTENVERLSSELVHESQPQITKVKIDASSFGIDKMFSVQDLFDARVHLGHKERMLNGHMRPYIFGKRLEVLIFDLDKTASLLKKALTVAAEMAYRGGIILFVHNSSLAGQLVEDTAKECGEFAFCRKWDETSFTDAQRVFGTVVRQPDLFIVMSTISSLGEPHKAIKTAASMLIPSIAICDTNSDPTLVTYPVPGNDDTLESIDFYCRLFKQAISRGKEKRKEVIENFGKESYFESFNVSID